MTHPSSSADACNPMALIIGNLRRTYDGYVLDVLVRMSHERSMDCVRQWPWSPGIRGIISCSTNHSVLHVRVYVKCDTFRVHISGIIPPPPTHIHTQPFRVPHVVHVGQPREANKDIESPPWKDSCLFGIGPVPRFCGYFPFKGRKEPFSPLTGCAPQLRLDYTLADTSFHDKVRSHPAQQPTIAYMSLACRSLHIFPSSPAAAGL